MKLDESTDFFEIVADKNSILFYLQDTITVFPGHTSDHLIRCFLKNCNLTLLNQRQVGVIEYTRLDLVVSWSPLHWNQFKIMQALRYLPQPGAFSLEDNVPHPKIIHENEVLVEVQYAGLCGTDIHIVQVRIVNQIEK